MLMPTVSPVGAGGVLSVSIVNGQLSYFGFRYGNGTAQTSTSFSVTVSNGVGPYTYLCEEVGGPGGLTPVSPDLSSTKFSTFFTSSPDEKFGTFRYKVTDSLGSIGYSAEVDATLESL